MWFIGVEVEQETSAPPPKKILDPPLKPIGQLWLGGLRYRLVAIQEFSNNNSC